MDVVAGQYHSLCLTASGKVFTWGWGIHGQLGHNNCDNVYVPKALEFKRQVKQIAAGQAHSLILTVDGELYGFGSNFFGQLGEAGGSKVHFPSRIVLDEDKECNVQTVIAAYFHNVSQTFSPNSNVDSLDNNFFHAKTNVRQINANPLSFWLQN